MESTTSIHASCMGCKKTWTREFLVNTMPVTWINTTFKKHQESMMMDQEKSLLPATQEHVKRTVNERKLREELKTLKEQKKELMIQLADLKTKIYETEGNIYRLGNPLYTTRSSTKECKPLILGSCPRADCKGFLGSDWKCQLCESVVCSNCRMEKVDAHECKPDDVETAKFLQKDAKPCPKCAALCHKVDGCHQVFCINCKTAFNYQTLAIESGWIHAPDYYRWVRESGGVLPRAHGDVPCDERNVHAHTVKATLRRLHINDEVFMDIHRLTGHIRAIELPSYRVNMVDDNLDLRIMYMLNEIDETKWKRMLQQRNKAREKKQEIHAVLETFVMVASDIMRRVVAMQSDKEADGLFGEFEQLRRYLNDRLIKISYIFNCVVPYIRVDWSSVDTKKAVDAC